MIERWRVDCRKERGPWKTLLTTGYATQAEAEAACLEYRASGEWDTAEVMSGLEQDLQRVRGCATGSWCRQERES
jgi:hypothetical protein